MTTIAVLLTSHDRREQTLSSLAALERQVVDPAVSIRPVLVDAGSRDGTAAAVAERFPATLVEERGRDLFWNGGMRAAWEAADALEPHAVLWLNDDTVLDPDAVTRLLELHRRWPTAIVVGATRDPTTMAVTYSGVHRPDRRRPLSFHRVEPTDEPQRVETMNGNCVLVPAAVAERVGRLDPVFTHAMGDFDYGLRAGQEGFEVLLAPGTVGTCAANPPPRGRSVTDELTHLRGPKGLPPAEWATFARRWAGRLWPLYWASPYIRRLARARRRP